MSSEIKITFISDGFREILISDGVRSVVSSAADKIASRANSYLTGDGGGYEAYTEISSKFSNYSNGDRWAGFVASTDQETRMDEYYNSSLSRAVT